MTTITQLPSATSVNPTDYVPIVQAGTTKKTSVGDLSPEISVKSLAFGAVGDGLTDDGPAFLLWWAYLQANPNSTGYIPSGIYNLTAITDSMDLSASNITVRGAGSDSTRLLVGYTYRTFYKANAIADSERFTLNGFTIEGPRSSIAEGLGLGLGTLGYAQTPVELWNIDEVNLWDIQFYKIPALALALRGCENVSAYGTTFREIARGGANLADSRHSVFSVCHFIKCGDDAISWHERDGGLNISSHSASSCDFFMCQGIKGLGTRNVAVSGCTFEFMRGFALDVSTVEDDGAEGSNATINISFTGNTVKDTFNNLYATGAGQARVIHIGGLSVSDHGLSAVPGYNVVATGEIIRMEPYIYNYSSSGTPAPIPPSHNINLSGNSFLQTLPETAAFSDLGFGEIFGYEGELVDPAVAFDTLMDVDLINADGYLNDVMVATNEINGFRRMLVVGEGAGANARLRNFVISTNGIRNCRLCVIDLSTTLDNDPDGLDISFRNNNVDLDPYLASSNRLSTGGWASNAANSDGLLVKARGNNATQIRVYGNEFKNMLGVGSVTSWGNTWFCNPTSMGVFDTANLGCGFPRFNERVFLVDSDPTSATYGAIINQQLDFDTAMPATGKYVQGHVVRKSNAAVAGSALSKYVINGWLRLTTGTGHVADTDWAEMRTLTGT